MPHVPNATTVLPSSPSLRPCRPAHDPGRAAADDHPTPPSTSAGLAVTMRPEATGRGCRRLPRDRCCSFACPPQAEAHVRTVTSDTDPTAACTSARTMTRRRSPGSPPRLYPYRGDFIPVLQELSNDRPCVGTPMHRGVERCPGKNVRARPSRSAPAVREERSAAGIRVRPQRARRRRPRRAAAPRRFASDSVSLQDGILGHLRR